jgi:hypothetical protein
MNLEPEDLISPEDEAEMQRNVVLDQSAEVLEAIQRFHIAFKANPEIVPAGAYEMLGEGLSQQLAWMRQNGIGLPQQDVDGNESPEGT